MVLQGDHYPRGLEPLVQATSSGKGDRRFKRWAPGGLHFKLTVTTFSVAAVVLSCSLLANLLGWSSAFRDPPHDVNAALNQGYVTLVRNTVFTLLFAVPFTGWVAMTYLFRICGPLYGVRRYLRRIQDGDWSGECRIRAQDELRDLNDDVNGAVETLLAHLRIETRPPARSPRSPGGGRPSGTARATRRRGQRASPQARRIPYEAHNPRFRLIPNHI